MVLLAAGIKLHVNPFWLATIVSCLSLAGLPFLLARIAGRRLEPLGAMFVMGAFILLPQMNAAALGFSVLPFAFLLVAMVYSFLRERNAALALLALLLCLFRPDGVVFAVPLMAAALLIYPNRGRRTILFASLFVVPGVAYFVWRWHYFNSFLPLPFLVKANTPRFAKLFVLGSVQKGLFLTLFVLAICWLVLRGQERLKAPKMAVLICTFIVPDLFYFAMRLDQNIGHRFFIFLPVAAALLLAMEWDSVSQRKGYFLVAGVLLWIVLVAPTTYYEWGNLPARQHYNRKLIAEDLSRLPHGSLVVTEAGLLPYYSNWPAVDAWGLNTAEFSRRLFQPSDVEAIKPDLMLVDIGDFEENGSCTVGADWQTPYSTRTWQHLIRNLIVGGQPPQYDLWYTPYHTIAFLPNQGVQPWQGHQECWFIKSDSPLRQQVETVLRSHYGLPIAGYREKLSTENSSHAQSQSDRPAPMKRHSLRSAVFRVYKIWRGFAD